MDDKDFENLIRMLFGGPQGTQGFGNRRQPPRNNRRRDNRQTRGKQPYMGENWVYFDDEYQCLIDTSGYDIDGEKIDISQENGVIHIGEPINKQISTDELPVPARKLELKADLIDNNILLRLV